MTDEKVVKYLYQNQGRLTYNTIIRDTKRLYEELKRIFDEKVMPMNRNVVRVERKKKPTEDLMNRKFTNLTVISRAEDSPYGKARWTCRCKCGNKITVLAESLKSGHTKSCGCLRKKYVK